MKTYRIVLVDDEEMILSALTRTLRSAEYKLYTALNAETALQIVKDHQIDLVISDYKMGNINGLQLFELINKISPDTLNILLTGNADIHMAIEAINKSLLYKFILKPWDNDDLKITVKRALEQRDLLHQNTYLTNELKKRDKMIGILKKNIPAYHKSMKIHRVTPF